ncbi:MAG: hypothetical protein A4E65_00184 [Syntrophorhabdus sp. PtaU1.Bin153]|nr:MAG: hypothetical protein A4E65_00184 [Syntrophorhabdus sp. PtaU1.Bin153]
MKKYLMMILLALVAMSLVALPVALAEAVDAVPVQPGIDLTPFFQSLIALLASIITVKLIPWINSRTNAQQQSKMRAAVRVAVFAAEQLYGAGNGKDKLMFVKGKLSQQGFKIDVDEIEAQVRELTAEGASVQKAVK